jgi:hypothetical protein
MPEVKVIVVADDDDQARADGVPPGIIAMLGPSTILTSNDSLRVYVRTSHFKAMQSGHEITSKK